MQVVEGACMSVLYMCTFVKEKLHGRVWGAPVGLEHHF